MKNHYFRQSTLLDYVINDLNQDSAGTYRCVAKNNAGVSTAFTEVKVIGKFKYTGCQ